MAPSHAPGRILAVDAVRGLAMVLVIYAHCHALIDETTLHPRLAQAFEIAIGFAAVAFVAIAGAMFGYLHSRAGDRAAVRARYRRRALQLLLIAHPAITLTRFFYYHPDWDAAGFPAALLKRLLLEIQVTDTIALCILVATVIFARIERVRAWAIVALLVAAPIEILWAGAPAGAWRYPQALLFGAGPDPAAWPVVPWPLAPWLAIFLAGTAVGPDLAAVRAGRRSWAELAARLRRPVLPLLGVALIYGLAYEVLRHEFGERLDPRLLGVIYPGQTTGLLPAYLAALLWLSAAALRSIDGRGGYRWPSRALALFGRASLFVFVLQFVFAQSLPAVLGMKHALGLLGVGAWFVATTVLCWGLAYGYAHLRGVIPRSRSETPAPRPR